MYGQNDFRNYVQNDRLEHHGILGQKWGIRRYQYADGSLTPAGKKRYVSTSHQDYNSTSLKSAIARHQNKKVDDSFDEWKTSEQNKETAVQLGKIANEAKRNYEKDPTKQNKVLLKSAEKDYKQALRKNTIYNKGQAKQEVDADMSRKYLSEAKKVKKLLDNDPNNAELQKQYSELMSQHDIYRASARRATHVAARRSAAVASVKTGATLALKGAATAATIAAGTYAINSILASNGSNIRLTDNTINNAVNIGKTISDASKYLYF